MTANNEVPPTPLPPVPPPPAPKLPEPKKVRGYFPIELGELREEPWVLPGVFRRRELVFVTARPSAGKSLACLDLACSLAGGIAWRRGFAPRTPARVAYLAGEGGGREARRRIHAWLESASERAEVADEVCSNLWTVPEPVQIDEKTVGLLVDAIYEAFGGHPVDLVVVDTWNACTLGADENSATEAAERINVVRWKLQAEKIGAPAVLVVHHPPKGGRGLRGSGALEGAADLVVELERKKGSNIVKVECTKANRVRPFDPFKVEIREHRFLRDGGEPETDDLGLPVTSAVAVPVEEPCGNACGSTGGTQSGLARPPEDVIDRVGQVVRELVRTHHKGRARSKTELERSFDATRDEDHAISRKDYRRTLPFLAERGWIQEVPEGAGKRTVVLPGPGPVPAPPSVSENGPRLVRDESPGAPDPAH